MNTMKATRQCYQDMKQRCLNKNHAQYKNYGARGITICNRWLEGFDNFLLDMWQKPAGLTIDRIDNNWIYEPENCRWATQAEQRINQRFCRFIDYAGERLTVEHW